MRKKMGRIALGHPVDVASGIFFGSWEDINIPGQMDLSWERHYSTALLDDPASALGPGWVTGFFCSLRRDIDGYRFRNTDGHEDVFDDLEGLVEQGEVIRNLGAFSEIRKVNGSYIISQWTTDFSPVCRFVFIEDSPHTLIELASIEYVNGQGLDLYYDNQKRLKIIKQRRENRQLIINYNTINSIMSLEIESNNRSEEFKVQYEYDEHGRLILARDILGYENIYEYDNDNRMIREIWPDGTFFRWEYDYHGRCVHTAGSNNYAARTFSFRALEHTTEVIDSVGQTWVYHWNENGQVERIISPKGAVRLTNFDEYGRIIEQVDPNGAVTKLTYDDIGNLAAITNPLGHTVRYEFNANRQITLEIDEGGNEWKREYDASGYPLADQDPLGNRWTFQYTTRGDRILVTNPLGATRRMRYNNSGEVIEETDYEGNTTQFVYDADGRVVRHIDALGSETWITYDALGQVIQIDYADGSRDRFVYDAVRNLTHFIDQNGHVTQFEYGPCGLLFDQIDPRQGREKYVWSSEPGRLMEVHNAQGDIYHYEYDADGHVEKEIGFDGRVLEFTCDAAGNCIRVKDGLGNVTNFMPDALGQVTKTLYSDGTEVVDEFDPTGELITSRNPACELQFKRDAFGRVILEKQGNFEIQNDYDAVGNRIQRRINTRVETEYRYDHNSNIIEVLHAGRVIAKMEQDRLGQEIRRLLPGGIELRLEYDSLGQLVTQWAGITSRALDDRDFGGGSQRGTFPPYTASPLIERRYHYDPVGNQLQISDQRWGSVKYTYDAGDLVVTAQREQGWSESFNYDVAGNVRSSSHWPSGPLQNDVALPPGVTETRTLFWEYGPGDRLLHLGDTTYEHDAQGRVIRKTTIRDGKAEVLEYEWDAAEQLALVRLPDGRELRYQYDSLGRRIAEVGPDGIRRWYWDGDDICAFQEAEGPPINYIFEPDNFRPLAREATDSTYSYITDHLGTPRELLGPGGQLAWSAMFSVWGEAAEVAPRGRERLRFLGQVADPDTALHYNRFRYYDPESGRYLSADPLRLAFGTKLYAYGVNPIVWTDPLGLNASNESGFAGERALKRLYGKGDPATTFPMRGKPDRRVDGWYPNEGPGGIAREAKAGKISLSEEIKSEIERDKLLMRRTLKGKKGKIRIEWHFFKSPITGEIGPNKVLRKKLKAAGIDIVLHPRAKCQ
jgi:RHS repeat-associated protein